MNISIWLARRKCSINLFKTNLTLCSNPLLPIAASSFSTCLFHSHLTNSVITNKDCRMHHISCISSSAASFMARRYIHAIKASFEEDQARSVWQIDGLELGNPNTTCLELRVGKINPNLGTFYAYMGVDFPGGKIEFTSKMNFLPGSPVERVQCYRILDEDGYSTSSNIPENATKELVLKVYTSMVTLQTMDTLFYEAQRQGRLSFYLTSFGEEAINIASAASLTSHDYILAQYREQGVLLWRGFTLQEFANHFLGNKNGHGKGRNMPLHFGSKTLNYFTNSAPLATQLPQAVGVAYSLKMDKKNACVVAYLGDGSTSEGDFHASLNFAAVLEAPVVFICRNNGWAISTPVTEQFRSDGVIVKGQAYGIQSIRIDGNDALAVYNAVQTAREMAINEQRPILIEAMTYRVGNHSTSDDSTKYRTKDEIEHWKTTHSPITRLRKWIERKGWWSQEEESELHISQKKQVKHAIKEAENEEKPPLKDMFTDVYDELPSNLVDQERMLREAIKKHPKDFPTDIPL